MNDKLDRKDRVQEYINLNHEFKARFMELVSNGESNAYIKCTLEREFPAQINFISNAEMNDLLEMAGAQRFLKALSELPDKT